MTFFKSTNTRATTLKIESQEMKSLTKVIVIVHAFYVFRARLRRRPLPRARPTVGVARRTAPHRDAFETTIARMGIFDDVFGARARRAGGTKTTNATNASSLFASSSEFRAETEGSGTRARRPSATTTARATTTTTGKRRRKSADDDERRASSSEEADEEKDGRAVAAVGTSDDESTDDDGDDDSDSDEKAPKATPRGSGYRDRDEEAEADALARTVFVGNVPARAKSKKLKATFSAHGRVVSVRMRNVPVEAEGNEPRKVKVLKKRLNAERGNATAFVVFAEASSAKKACEALNMKEFEGRHIRVDLAGKPSIVQSEVVYDHARSVFLGHLPFTVDDEDVIRLFNKNKEYPELRRSVEAVRVVRDRKTTLGKGIGFVLFKTKEQARTALLLDGTKLGDREIRVSKAARSKAPKPGAASKARAEPKALSGAERRNPKLRAGEQGESKSRGGNSWEGSRSRPGGKSQKTAHRRGDARPAPGGGGKPNTKKGIAKQAKRTGKRPAVAARKAKAKASAASGRA